MIETKRLLLRPFEEKDLELVFRLYSDEDTLRYTPFDRETREQAAEHLKRIMEDWSASPRTSLEMAVVRKETGEGIGRTHILIDPETDTGMIGWLLTEQHRGRHYATEMTPALLRYSFHTLGLHRVNAVCHPDNIASWRVLEACGLRREAWMKEKCRYLKNGSVSWQDELEYAILAKEYENMVRAGHAGTGLQRTGEDRL